MASDEGNGSRLRHLKRQRVREGIESAAAALFDERGIDGVRMADIARRAEVSEATLYNHYANKAALAERWARQRLGRAATVGAAGNAPSEGPRQRGRGIARAVADEAARARADLERVWSRGGRTAPEEGAAAAPGDLVAWLRHAQHAGEVRADIPADELGELVWCVIEGRVRAWLDAAQDDAEALAQSIQRAVAVVLDGCRKRHERVRASADVRPVPAPPS